MIFSIMEREAFIISEGCHTENVLMAVLEGSFTFSLDGISAVAGENDVIYFEKGKEFSRRVLSPLKIIYIVLDPAPELETGLMVFRDDARKRGTVELLRQSIESGNKQMVRYFCYDLVTQYDFENPRKLRAVSDEVLAFYEYVEKNYKSKLSVKDFSESVYMSHTGFLLKFKREVGISPIEYIKNFRLEEAARLLLDSSMPIGRIAIECGYENLYYFSNAFKKQYNISPSEFRKNML